MFEENYLGKTGPTFTLNFSTGSAMVLAQYYNLVRYGRGYAYIMKNVQQNAARLPRSWSRWGRFELIGPDEEQLPLVAFRLGRAPTTTTSSTLPGSCRPNAAGWCRRTRFLRMPGRHDHALVKETLSREHVDTLVQETSRRHCATFAKGGGPRVGTKKIIIGPSQRGVSQSDRKDRRVTEPICGGDHHRRQRGLADQLHPLAGPGPTRGVACSTLRSIRSIYRWEGTILR